MRDILVTSSVLILALLVLRQAFCRTISRRVQYALWGLVLLRLLAPVNLPAMEHNVLSAAEPVRTQVAQQLDRQEIYIPMDREPLTDHPNAPDLAPDLAMPASSSQVWVAADDETAVQYQKLTPAELLCRVWYAGIAVMACWLVVSNLRFWHKLRKARKPYSVENCKYRVYLVESGLPSPCLFGLFRPAIYLTPAATASPESLRHVLAHETTHARHLDPLWSLLRGVCLAVYWFDPLVWIAAAVSKTDCELACDEGALKRLGETERIAYGRTLLALIPVAKRPADPMLAATTMTSGKRRLKDRITRIAENRQTVSAALFAAVALAGLVCAVTFTGARSAAEEVPLTGEELTYFNKTFFNGGTVGVNIHNQFLTSLYAQPEDIDLYSLFYLLGSTPGDAEIRAAFQAEPDALSYPAYRITTGEMDAVLSENTGLTLAETHQVSLDRFEVYDPANSAYYWVTGDTGPGNEIVFSAGTREQDTVRLYYTAQFYSGSLYSGWACVTLEAQADGGYRFVSNLACEQPAIPTVYPEGDPVLTIPLTGLAPYEPPAVETRRFAVGTGRSRVLAQYSANDQSIVVCRTFNGGTGVGVENDGAYDCFLYFTAMQEHAADSLTVHSFSGLFGCDGWVVSYYGLIDEVHEQGDGQVTRDSQTYSVATFYRIYGTVNDYYTFADDGSPVLLVRTYGTPQRIDLDGDGNDELVTSGDAAQITFQRDGQLYQADITALLQDRWPEIAGWDYSFLDASSRCLTVSGFVEMPDWADWSEGAQATFTRYVYFGGENLLVYDNLEDTEDHAAHSVLSGDIPEQVLADGKAAAEADYTYAKQLGGYWHAVLDDWRVSYLKLVNTHTEFSCGPIEVYSLGYQFHSAKPSSAFLAGGMYIQEDGWIGGFNSINEVDTSYLVYRLGKDGARVRLESCLTWDYSVDSLAYRADLCRMLLVNGQIAPTELSGNDLCYMAYIHGFVFLNELADYPAAQREATLRTLVSYLKGGAREYEQGLFQDTLQSLIWTQQSLTEGGRAAYQQLRDLWYADTDWGAPSEDLIHETILNHHSSQTARRFDLYAEAHHILDTALSDNGRLYTIYAMINYNSYTVEGGAWKTGTGGYFPAAITFAAQDDGSWVLKEYWEPDSARYRSELQQVFPAAAAETALGGEEILRELSARCDAAAERFAATEKADVQFSWQPLETTADPMTYAERWAWCQQGGDTEGSSRFIVNSSMADADHYLVYTGNRTGSPPETHGKRIFLRFPDGSLAELPLPEVLDDTDLIGTSFFTNGTYVYNVDFPEELRNGSALVHLKGTYRYEVDLTERRVTLTVLDN